MKRLLSLAWLTVRDAHPIEHVEAAQAAGFDAVGLRIVPPSPTDPLIPVIGDEPLIRELRAHLDATGVRVLDVETVWIGPAFNAAALLPALELAQRLGCHQLLTMGQDREPGRMLDHFSRLCEAAARFNVNVGLEFAAYTAVPTLADAGRIVAASGQDNARVLVDALHLARSGGTPREVADFARAQPGRIAYAQIADARGPRPADDEALKTEARGGRYLPGEGDLPLAELVAALPAGLALGVETPCAALAGTSVMERAKRAAQAMKSAGLAGPEASPGQRMA